LGGQVVEESGSRGIHSNSWRSSTNRWLGLGRSACAPALGGPVVDHPDWLVLSSHRDFLPRRVQIYSDCSSACILRLRGVRQCIAQLHLEASQLQHQPPSHHALISVQDLSEAASSWPTVLWLVTSTLCDCTTKEGPSYKGGCSQIGTCLYRLKTATYCCQPERPVQASQGRVGRTAVQFWHYPPLQRRWSVKSISRSMLLLERHLLRRHLSEHTRSELSQS